MKLTTIKELDLSGKRVLVRLDLDFDPKDTENFRFKTSIPTLDHIKASGGKIIILGHRGRPEGKVDENLSLMPFSELFNKWDVEVVENLRFDPGEESNSIEFAKSLAEKGDIYINESFATSHREHASVVVLPKLLPHAAGIRFSQEVENLGKVLSSPQKPVVFIISGFKDGKLNYIPDFLKIADKILIGGRMPDHIHDTSALRKDDKVLVGGLLPDKEDLTINAIEQFEREIEKAGTIVVSGPLGKYEEEGHRQGTERILRAVTNSQAYKVAGGGDTLSAIKLLGLEDKFDWLSVGGGAMLEFLAKSTLPGIEVLLR